VGIASLNTMKKQKPYGVLTRIGWASLSLIRFTITYLTSFNPSACLYWITPLPHKKFMMH
jgi:hypothetical protein